MGLLKFFAYSWILTGIWGILLSLRLLTVTSHDRGMIRALKINGVAKLLYDKLMRVGYQRLVGGLFGAMVGILTITDLPTHPVMWTATSLSLALGFLWVQLLNILVTYLDLRDRQKMSKEDE